MNVNVFVMELFTVADPIFFYRKLQVTGSG